MHCFIAYDTRKTFEKKRFCSTGKNIYTCVVRKSNPKYHLVQKLSPLPLGPDTTTLPTCRLLPCAGCQERNQHGCYQHASNSQEARGCSRLRLDDAPVPRPAAGSVLIHPLLRPLVRVPVKVPHVVVPVAVRVLPRPHPRLSPTTSTNTTSRTTTALLVCGAALRPLRAPPTRAEEAGRGPSEGGSSAAQAAGGTAAGGARAMVGSLVRSVLLVMVVVVVARHDVSVVVGALVGVAEHGVGFAYAHEAAAGVGVIGVVVWVMGFGKLIKGSM